MDAMDWMKVLWTVLGAASSVLLFIGRSLISEALEAAAEAAEEWAKQIQRLFQELTTAISGWWQREMQERFSVGGGLFALAILGLGLVASWAEFGLLVATLGSIMGSAEPEMLFVGIAVKPSELMALGITAGAMIVAACLLELVGVTQLLPIPRGGPDGAQAPSWYRPVVGFLVFLAGLLILISVMAGWYRASGEGFLGPFLSSAGALFAVSIIGLGGWSIELSMRLFLSVLTGAIWLSCSIVARSATYLGILIRKIFEFIERIVRLLGFVGWLLNEFFGWPKKPDGPKDEQGTKATKEGDAPKAENLADSPDASGSQ